MTKSQDHKDRTPATEPFSQQLEVWSKGNQPKTLKGLDSLFAEKSFAMAFLLLMIISALPLPTGGVTHVFEIITMLLALELVVGRQTIWLPRRWQHININKVTRSKAFGRLIKIIRWLERFSRRRLADFLASRALLSVIGVVIFVFALTAFLAPPFSGLDTLPSLGVVLIALALLLDDVVILVVGLVVGVAGIATVIGLGAGAFKLIFDVFKHGKT